MDSALASRSKDTALAPGGGGSVVSLRQANVITAEVLMGLFGQPNIAPSAFLPLISESLGERIASVFGSGAQPITVLRALESVLFIEMASYDRKAKKEDRSMAVTPMGAVWLAIFEATDIQGGEGVEAVQSLQSLRMEDLLRSERLIDYSRLDVEAALLGLSRFGIVSLFSKGSMFAMRRSPLDELIFVGAGDGGSGS